MHRAIAALTALVVIIQVRSHEDISSIVDVKSLSVLPLEALLNIKRNVLNFSVLKDAATFKENNSPEALPFHGIIDVKKKADYFVHSDDHHEKKKSISQFFQLSVTYLAFLAFGGYLLFLIVAAIKNKQYNYMNDPNVTQIMSAMIDAEFNKRKKKKKKRPIRGGGMFGYKQEEKEPLGKSRKLRARRELLLNDRPDVEEMYQVLVNLCEGYTKIAGLDNT